MELNSLNKLNFIQDEIKLIDERPGEVESEATINPDPDHDQEERTVFYAGSPSLQPIQNNLNNSIVHGIDLNSVLYRPEIDNFEQIKEMKFEMNIKQEYF